MRDTKLWIWHMIAGMAILLLGGMHIITMHMDDILGWFNADSHAAAIGWTNVVARASSYCYVGIYIALLGFTLFHGFYGLRNILLETKLGRKMEKFIKLFLCVFGTILFALGTYVAIAAQMKIGS
jgi:succinate dehydrogenase hydrophobic anchor subunit